MSLPHPILVRCAHCRWNFETRRLGHQPCPNCHAEVLVETPDGLVVPDEAPDPEAPDPPRLAEQESEPPPASAPDGSPSETLLEMLQEKLQTGKRPEESVAGGWENRRGNRLVLFFRVGRQVLLSPTLFFSSLRDQRIRPALLFGGIVSTVAIFAAFAYGLWNLDANREALLAWLRIHAAAQDPSGVLAQAEFFMQIMLFGSPLVGILNVVLMAGLYHLGLLVTGRDHRGFGATLCATAYGLVPTLLAAVPTGIGMLVGSVWPLVLHALGLAVLHRVSVVRGVLAVMIPVLILALATLALIAT